MNAKRLRSFVEEGGCAYISDLAFFQLDAAFPGVLKVECEGEECELSARVEDPELSAVIGERVDVTFDLDSWAIIRSTEGLAAHGGRVLLRSASGGRYRDVPLMVSFSYGRGRVFYTSFHNHAQASERETVLLKLLLLKQIATHEGGTVADAGPYIASLQ